MTITIIIKPRDDNAIDGEYWQHAWIYIFIYTIHFTCSLPLRVSLVSASQQRRRRRPSAARSPALRCFALPACSLARVSARVTASICLQPSNIHPAHAPNTHPLRHRHHPALPHPPPIPPSIRHRRIATPTPPATLRAKPVHTNPSQITPAAPRGGAASVTTAHPPTCGCLPPSISRRSRSAQGALTTA